MAAFPVIFKNVINHTNGEPRLATLNLGFRLLLPDTGFAGPQQDVGAVQFSAPLSTAGLKSAVSLRAVIPAKAGTRGEYMDSSLLKAEHIHVLSPRTRFRGKTPMGFAADVHANFLSDSNELKTRMTPTSRATPTCDWWHWMTNGTVPCHAQL